MSESNPTLEKFEQILQERDTLQAELRESVGRIEALSRCCLSVPMSCGSI